MNPSQARLVNYVRGLHQRDQHGPDAFPIIPAKSTGQVASPAIKLKLPTAGVDLKSHKQREAFKRGLSPEISIANPKSPPFSKDSAWPALTEQAAEAYERVIRNKNLTENDLIHLESIVLPALRPAFDIQNGTYGNLPKNWDPLNKQRKIMEPIIRGVGRLQLTGHPSYTMVGTGFVCGANAILTNRHVAQIFVQGIESGGQLSFLPDVSCAMDMKAEVGSSSTLLLDVSHPVVVSTVWDVAIFHVEFLSPGIQPLPLARSAPASISDGFAAIVGYPTYDSHESFVDQANIFRAVFDRKRLQPGKLNGRADVASFGRTVEAIQHDCSTLGGNSGSALISVETAQVVGIHFSGVTHVSNYAVPTWELDRDPAFVGQTLSFA